MKLQKAILNAIVPRTRCMMSVEMARKVNQMPKAHTSRPKAIPKAYRALAVSASIAKPSTSSGCAAEMIGKSVLDTRPLEDRRCQMSDATWYNPRTGYSQAAKEHSPLVHTGREAGKLSQPPLCQECDARIIVENTEQGRKPPVSNRYHSLYSLLSRLLAHNLDVSE